MKFVSKEAKLLILTWVVIGFVVSGLIGFYLGRNSIPQNQGGPQGGVQQGEIQQPGPGSGQPQGSPIPTGGQRPPQGGQQNPPAPPPTGTGPASGGQAPIQ